MSIDVQPFCCCKSVALVLLNCCYCVAQIGKKVAIFPFYNILIYKHLQLFYS